MATPPHAATPVRLRPHHLLCVLTYAGKGYSPAFTAGFDALVTRLSQGAPVLIVDGPDDICAPLSGDATAHCLRDSVRQRDQQAAADLGALWQRPISPGVGFDMNDAMLLAWRQAFVQARTRTACGGCEWQPLCSRIAADGFTSARLQVVRMPGSA